ncbi:uncharacterized protein [Ptychodera flava]|uniref:uncharacterized protein n=1 Tax=Ptychodera flava TaxID=63121 RepID=UPI00396A9344
MASTTIEVILNLQNSGPESHTVPVHPGSSIRISLRNFLEKHGLRSGDLTAYDTTRKKSVNWDETVDGLLSSTVLISDSKPSQKKVFPRSRSTDDLAPPVTSPRYKGLRKVSLPATLPELPPRPGRLPSDTLPADIPERPPPPPPPRNLATEDVFYSETRSESTDITELPCYHGTLTTREVEGSLGGRPAYSFLVRDSMSKPGNYTVSANYHNKNIFHFHVNTDGGKYYVTEDCKFPNMPALLRYFQRHPIPGQHVQDLKLMYPITKPCVGKPNDKGYTEFIKKEALSTASYLATAPMGEQHLQSPKRNHLSRTDRPPAPLPETASAQGKSGSKLYSTTLEEGRSRLPELLQNLKVQERGSDAGKRCICGLFVEEATLIGSWMMHRSNDPETEGQIYFARGNEVVWDLPQETMAELERVNPKKAK